MSGRVDDQVTGLEEDVDVEEVEPDFEEGEPEPDEPDFDEEPEPEEPEPDFEEEEPDEPDFEDQDSIYSFQMTVPFTILPTWISPGENLLAARHRRSPLGYVMRPGSKLRYRLDPAYSSTRSVVLRLLNNDRNTEAEIEIESECWHEVSHPTTYVPFVDWLQVREEVGVEFQVSGPYHELPHYVYHRDDWPAFAQTYYETEESERYALLDLNLAAILVPPTNTIAGLDIDELYSFYNDIINYYDSLIGVHYAPLLKSSDGDFDKQFFVKADRNGPGAAYFGAFWTAHSSESLSVYLQPSPTNWLVLHEIAHAYDFVFTNFGTRLIEVWNNVLCDRMQYEWMNAEVRQLDARVYENRRPAVEAEIMSRIAGDVQFDSWGLFQKLMLFVWIMNTPNGPTTFRNINASFRVRKVARLVDPQIWTWMLMSSPDNISLLFDLYQVVSAKYYVSRTDILPLYYEHLAVSDFKKSVYPIKYLVDDYELMGRDYKIKRYMESNLDLVTPDVLRQTGLSAAMRVQCLIDDVAQIVDEPFYVYDGLEEVFHGVVDGAGVMHISQIAPGIYTVHAPRGKNNLYTLAFQNFKSDGLNLRVTVPPQEERLMYTPYLSSKLLMEPGHLLGFDRLYTGTFYVDLVHRFVRLHLNNNQPSPGAATSRFFEITVLDDEEKVRDQIIVLGRSHNLRLGWYEFPIYPGDTLRLFHHVNGRINFFGVESSHHVNSSTHSFSVTENDLIPLEFIERYPTKTERLLSRMNAAANWLDDHVEMMFIESELRDSIYLATLMFGPENAHLTNPYIKYFPDFYRGDMGLYRFKFKGVGNLVRAELECNLLTNTISVRVVATLSGPHQFFVDQYYIGMQVRDSIGNLVLRLALIGNVPTIDDFMSFPLRNNYTIQLFHQEPGRLELFKKDVKVDETFGRDTFLRVEHSSLKIEDGPSMMPDPLP